MVNFHLSRLFGFLSTVLTYPIIALDGFPALAVPILSVGYSSTKPVNVRRVIFTRHIFSTAFLRATNIFGVLKARWWDSNLFGTIRTFNCYFLYTTRPTVFSYVFLKTSPIAVLSFFAFSSTEYLFTLWTSFIYASLKSFAFVNIGALNTAKHIIRSYSIGFYLNSFATVIARSLDHCISQKVCPSWKSVLLFRQSVHSGHVLNKTSDLSNYLNTIIIPCAGLT